MEQKKIKKKCLDSDIASKISICIVGNGPVILCTELGDTYMDASLFSVIFLDPSVMAVLYNFLYKINHNEIYHLVYKQLSIFAVTNIGS